MGEFLSEGNFLIKYSFPEDKRKLKESSGELNFFNAPSEMI